MSEWRKGIAHWVEDGTAYVSVPFTWLLPEAYQRCGWYRALGLPVRCGGPAVKQMPKQVGEYADFGDVDALPRHNPKATYTTRGCPNECGFCIVKALEPEFIELTEWVPRPIVCDNNLTAASRRHFDRVIDSLKPLRGIDFNQGLDARLLTKHHARRLAELRLKLVRLAWDRMEHESKVMDAIAKLNAVGIGNNRIQVYVLIGFDDDPADALYRLGTLKKMKVRPDVMRYQPPESLRRNNYVAPGWTERELRRFCRYWNRQNWLSKVPFEEYR